MATFNDIKFIPLCGGKGGHIHFDNGYGASVVRFYGTYGSESGLYELAVLYNKEIDYDNSVAKGDVLGYLTEKAVTKKLQEIQNLPSKSTKTKKSSKSTKSKQSTTEQTTTEQSTTEQTTTEQSTTEQTTTEQSTRITRSKSKQSMTEQTTTEQSTRITRSKTKNKT